MTPHAGSAAPTEKGRTLWISTGAKVALILSLLLLVLGLYFLFVPLQVSSAQGIPFKCSNALFPPADQFAQNSCGSINTVYQVRAGAALVSAIVVGVGGVLTFGARRGTSDVTPDKAGSEA
jgi:hypothetical protein